MSVTLEHDARRHGHFRWMQGYRMDELFREMNLLQQVIQDAAREYFLEGEIHPRTLEARAQRTIQELFSAVIQSAIGQLLEEPDRRIGPDAIHPSALSRLVQVLLPIAMQTTQAFF